MMATVIHEVNGHVSTSLHKVSEEGFVAVVLLQPGENRVLVKWRSYTVCRKITYSPPPIDKFIRIVYVTCQDEELFQGPAEMDRSVNAAVRRIQVGALVMQTFVAESLREEGLPRKTFNLELTAKGLPKVHVLQLPLTLLEVHAHTEERLWEVVAMQILSSHLSDKRCKYLAFLSATRFSNPQKLSVSSEAEVVALTRGHVSLGGGGLALVGTGALYSWPQEPASVLSAFNDTSSIDSKQLMDFSGGRGNVRASLSSSSLLKEPLTFRTNFIVRQQEPSNVNMTVAPLAADSDTVTSSEDTSSSDVELELEAASLCHTSLKCGFNLTRNQNQLDGKQSLPSRVSGTTVSQSDLSSPDRFSQSLIAPSTGGLAASSFTNLATSLCIFGSGGDSDKQPDGENNPAVMTASFNDVSSRPTDAQPPKSLRSLPDLSDDDGLPCWNTIAAKRNKTVCRAFWARPNAIMLAYHKWLNNFEDGQAPQVKGSVVCAAAGVRLIELRDINTLAFHHWEWLGRAPPVLHIPWASVPKWPSHKQVQLLVMDAHGNLNKDCFVPRPL